jgi:hypothetical protein
MWFYVFYCELNELVLSGECGKKEVIGRENKKISILRKWQFTPNNPAGCRSL